MSTQLVVGRLAAKACLAAAQLLIQAADRLDGASAQLSTTTLTVLVPRDQFKPIFIGPFSVEINENTELNDVIVDINAVDNDLQVQKPLILETMRSNHDK